MATGSRPRIAIVGAGTAGISCARVLIAKGFDDIKIYESRDRIGGRIHGSSSLGKPVDMGPNWMHGSTRVNSALAFFRAPGVTLHDIGEESAIFSPQGTPYSAAQVAELEEHMWTYVERAIEYSKEREDEIDPSVSMYEYIAALVDEELPDNAMKRKQVKQAIKMFGFYIGEDVTRQSLKFACLEEPAPGDNLFVASGFTGILQDMARVVVKTASLRLQTPVSRVITVDDGVIVEAEGAREHYDAVVVSVPLGVLKQKDIVFEPALPEAIENAIKALGYGRLEKVYLRFPRQFWTSDNFQFFQPEYAEETNSAKWPMSAVSLAHLPEQYAQPVLLWYLYGEMSAHFLGLATEADKIQFLEPYYSRISGYDATRDAPDGLLHTAWSQDRHAGCGSYSNFQVGLVEGTANVDALRQGMPERRVWFAGEHCSDVLQLATVSGAYEAGQHAGAGVAARLGKNVSADE
ncbi:uncharacterized protein V1518DRAFT_408717 [Limtongia smithiae]|uniref:uncharacterized protein n=1 Tax=Limtongia smithiae TaxID=1125753 RepID=UPI0034CE7E86